MTESPLFWPAHLKDGILFVLDETAIPLKVEYIRVKNTSEAVDVIRQMKTRAFGQFLVVLNTFLLVLDRQDLASQEALLTELQKTAEALNNSRPTFPFAEVTGIVLGWMKLAIQEHQDIRTLLNKNIQGFLMGIRMKRLKRVEEIASVILNGDRILTHCNVSGELAMAAQICAQQSKDIYFFATETRPYFQGAKLTCWELKEAGAEVTLVADNAVGSLMADGLVNKVIVGSDRSCANGDIANKIGTYQIAVAAQEFGIPFYALTQPSNKIPSGDAIPIELRDPDELLVFEEKRIIDEKVKGFYPGFDVVPHELIERQITVDPSGRP